MKNLNGTQEQLTNTLSTYKNIKGDNLDTNTLNILEVAGVLGIDNLNASGSVYKSLCPFHREKTASFTIFPVTNTFKCFGCGAGSSVIDLVMHERNCDYSEAVVWLRETFDTDEYVVDLPIFKTAKPHQVIKNEMIRHYHNLLFHSGRETWFKDRLFTDSTIRKEGFGWDGTRYIIPVWLDEPLISPCIGIRRRASEFSSEESPKYLGLKGYNKATMYGRWYVRKAKTVFIFAGELDARLAIQDGLPAVSVVGGVNAFRRFPQNWSYLWFPHATNIIVVFDRKEAGFGAKIALEWESQRGRDTAFVYHWTYKNYDDYNGYRLGDGTVEHFIGMVNKQVKRLDLSNLLQE